MNKVNCISSFILLAFILMGLSSCNFPPSIKPSPNPLLIVEDTIFDEATQTFNIILSSDSTDGATLTFSLLDGDSLLMQNETGQFVGIAPLNDGYYIQLKAKWKDTTIIRKDHIWLPIPRKPVEPMAKEELQKLINEKDKSFKIGSNEHLTQGVIVKTIECQKPVTTLLEVIERLEQGVWTSVEVKEVFYDENNLVSEVTLKPTEKVIAEEDYEDEEEYYE